MKRLFFSLSLVLLLVGFVSAADVAYVVKTQSNVNSKITSAFSNLNYSYDVITDSQIASTDWSNYNILFIQDVLTNEAFLPLSSKNAVFLEKEIAEAVWTTGTLNIAFTTHDYLQVLESNIFSEGVFGNSFDPYITTSASKKVYYLAAKPSYVTRVSYSENQLLRATIAYSNNNGMRRVFFGLPSVSLWNPNTQKIFENSVKWAIYGADGDGDGYMFEQDCNDNNPDVWQYLSGYVDLDLDGFGNGSIVSVCSGDELLEGYVENNLDCDDLNEDTWPGAEEVAYDLIDNDCDGYDLADVDFDGYCESGYNIINSSIQCNLETGLIGTDCDDNDFAFNIGSEDLTKNCVNDAPVFVSTINNITVLETETVFVNFTAEDPEGEVIVYSLNDSRFLEDIDGEFSWETDYFDSGVYVVQVNASDGVISSSAIFKVEVLNNNRVPLCDEIPEISWEEDSNYSLNLSEYCYDEDFESLNFNFYNTSTNTEIVLNSLNKSAGIANFSSHENWYGEDWIVFSVSDGNNITLTNEIPLVVIPINDAPELIKQFNNINLTENVNLTNYLNLSEYFLDVDSNLTFFVQGNHFIDIAIDPETLLVSFYPEEDFVGSENIVFSASDGEEETYGNAFVASVNSSFNRLPEFLPFDCETNIDEEQEYSCIINATDRENDTLTFSIGDEHNLECSFDGNNLTYVSSENYNGVAHCELIVSDATGSRNETFEVDVLPINDAPELIKQFENINLTENLDSLNILNLSEYFLDVDSNLTFYVTGNHFIDIVINQNNMISFYPQEDFYGSENIVIEADDGEYSVFSNGIILNVSSVNKAPTFEPFDCETNIDEEQEYSCIINATDRENDTLTFSVGNMSNLNCSFDGNNLTYIASLNYNGQAHCNLTVSDGVSSRTGLFEVDVLPINDAPELIKQFENINLTENLDSLNILNLSEYFLDVDSNLTFYVTGNHFIDIVINQNNMISFYPQEDFYGSENIVIEADDGEYSVFSNGIILNVSSVNKAPTFEPFDCETNIDEEQEYSCIINATDRENDTLTFSIGDEHNLECSFDGNNLTYVSSENYNGVAHCELIVSDATGSRNETFEVDVLPINDAPVISSRSPESIGSIMVGQQQVFSINPFDVDGDSLGFSWLLDGDEVLTGVNTYSFIPLNRGNYIVQAFVFDQEYNASTFWEVFVGEESDFTCSQNNGDVCSADEFCPVNGRLINSSEQVSCCSVTCQKLPPSFSDIDDRCTNKTVGLKINFENPDEDEEYIIGEDEEIEVELEIENELTEDVDLDVQVYLYDLTENEVVDDLSDDLDVDEDDKETITFNFDINEDDLDEDNNYAIFAYVEDKDFCSEEYQTIVFERADNALVFKQIDLGYYSNSEGRYLDVSTSIDNIGSDDEDFVIRVENRELGLNFRSEEFELDEGKKKTFDFEVLLPQEISYKAYNFTLTLDYSGDRKSKTETLFIGPGDSSIVDYNRSQQESLQLMEIKLGQEKQEPFYFTYQKNAYISLDDLVNVGIVPLFVIVCLVFAICLFIYVYLFNKN